MLRQVIYGLGGRSSCILHHGGGRCRTATGRGPLLEMPFRNRTSLTRKPRPSASSRRTIERLGGNKILFQSLGCPRNLVDSEVMLGIVLQAGYEPTTDMSDANYIVVNTCGFLKEARDEGHNEISQLIESKKRGSKLIVTGCMINLHREEIKAAYPEIDHVLGAGAVDRILDVIQKEALDEDKNDDSSVTARSYLESGDTPRFVSTPNHYAYLKIAEGCRKRCSFCIIPKIKGRLKSKPEEQIILECKSLIANGASEIILIAQDLGDYGKDRREKDGLASLLRNLLRSIEDERIWLRLMYLYPDEITNELIEIIEGDSRVCRYLDMPIQHINDDVLRNMKRTTTGEDIRRTISKLREKLPGIHIRTSLMVGFPGETEEQFDELVRFVKEAKLDNVGAFKYSDEELAWSSRLPNHVPESVKQDRYERLMKAQLEVVTERNQKRAEAREVLEVVIEGRHPEHEELFVARYFGQCPEIDGQVIICDIAKGVTPHPGRRYDAEVIDYVDYDLVARIRS